MSKVVKATFGLMIASMIAKVLGFGRELALASSYGTSVYSDAYITAMNIPNVIFTVIGSSLGTVLIPMYMEVNKKLGEKESLKFINNIFNIVIILCIILSILGVVFTEQIVTLFAIGFKGDAFNIAVNFTRVAIISIVFIGLSYIMTAYLQINNNFTIPGLISVPKNIIIIISIFLSLKYGAYIMIIGTLIGISTEFLFQLPFAIKHKYKYKFYINFKDKYIKKMTILIGPVLIGIAVNQVNALIDRTLASTLVEGSISALNYANKLNNFVMALFIASISSVIYPILAKASSKDDKIKFIESVSKSINSIILLVTPISIGAMVLATPIVSILFERGEFDSRATQMTAVALIMYSIGMVAFGLTDVLGKVFYSIQDTKTPMVSGAISMVINIILNIILIRYLKLAGLALSTSISALICILLLFYSLKKKIGYFGQDKVIITSCKAILASAIMGFVTYLSYIIIYKLIAIKIIALGLSILLGGIIYILLIILFKVDEVNIIINKLTLGKIIMNKVS